MSYDEEPYPDYGPNVTTINTDYLEERYANLTGLRTQAIKDLNAIEHELDAIQKLKEALRIAKDNKVI